MYNMKRGRPGKRASTVQGKVKMARQMGAFYAARAAQPKRRAGVSSASVFQNVSRLPELKFLDVLTAVLVWTPPAHSRRSIYVPKALMPHNTLVVRRPWHLCTGCSRVKWPLPPLLEARSGSSLFMTRKPKALLLPLLPVPKRISSTKTTLSPRWIWTIVTDSSYSLMESHRVYWNGWPPIVLPQGLPQGPVALCVQRSHHCHYHCYQHRIGVCCYLAERDCNHLSLGCTPDPHSFHGCLNNTFSLKKLQIRAAWRPALAGRHEGHRAGGAMSRQA